MSTGALTRLRAARDAGRPAGITSVCSAHPVVIEAALLEASGHGGDVLIEATCNQVNQDGGYTGMTPVGFRDFVHGIADRVGVARARVVLGGDHLGPNPWRHLPAEEAMRAAVAMIEAYAAAGYEKLHLDCSMGCASEPAALDDAVVAARAATLAQAAEAAAAATPVYVIGTEVPTPGGATPDGDAGSLDHLTPTRAEAVRVTYEVHRAAFRDVAGGAAWDRLLAMVVQPGVEFGHEEVAVYRPERARALAATLDDLPGLVFEAHSTDYQPEAALSALVRDGFPILKVGPWLTFAMREALYGLELIAGELGLGAVSVRGAAEAAMLTDPGYWQSHYPGSEGERRLLRHFSYSDRVRYYWGVPVLRHAVADLLGRFGTRNVPATLVSQYLPRLVDRVAAGALAPHARTLLVEAVRDVLRLYARACAPHGTQGDAG